MNRVLAATALTAGMALLGAQAARADAITQTFTFDPLPDSLFEAGPTLDGFNSALGTLTSVVFSDSVTATWSGGGSSDFNQAIYLVEVRTEGPLLTPSRTGDGRDSAFGSLRLTASAQLAGFTDIAQPTYASLLINNAPTASLTSTFGTGTLTYNYTPKTPAAVPEPGSLALLGTGLLGLALLRRRRRG